MGGWPWGLCGNPVCMSFRGVRQPADDEESRMAFKILRAGFLAALKMVVPKAP